ncbi:hypothetical protein B0H16DRAFT_1715468 [Mycena metata]|uniref:Uncharacterized protein n=1 Tax=Mycena metata TaxID=1033252 RepID=A0AAD7JQH4_9AGAR|nr:hypothetical protein B0H16DRAFT_1715468 [Mycena metata]
MDGGSGIIELVKGAFLINAPYARKECVMSAESQVTRSLSRSAGCLEDRATIFFNRTRTSTLYIPNDSSFRVSEVSRAVSILFNRGQGDPVLQFDSNLIIPTPSETVAKQEHTDKIMVDETPESEPEREETPEPEAIPEKGYSLSMELVEFEDLNYDDEIFGLPEDQNEQTFGQESAKGDNSEVSEEEMTELESTPESRSKAQLQEWLDALKQITFGSQAGDVEAGNQLRQRLAELEQKVFREEAAVSCHFVMRSERGQTGGKSYSRR